MHQAEDIASIVSGLRRNDSKTQRDSLEALQELTERLPFTERDKLAPQIRPLLIALLQQEPPPPTDDEEPFDPLQGGWPYIPEEREVQASMLTLTLRALEQWGQPSDLPHLFSPLLKQEKLKRLTQTQIAQAIVQVGGVQAIPYCIEALKSNDPYLIELAFKCLEHLPEPSVMQTLQELVHHEENMMHRNASRVLCSFEEKLSKCSEQTNTIDIGLKTEYLLDIWQDDLETLHSLFYRSNVVEEQTQRLLHILQHLDNLTDMPQIQKQLAETYACLQAIQPKALQVSQEHLTKLNNYTLALLKHPKLNYWQEQWEEGIF